MVTQGNDGTISDGNLTSINVDGQVLPTTFMLSHVSTVKDASDALQHVCGVEVAESLIQATQLRLMGNTLAQEGDLQGAISKYSEGIALQPAHGLHLLLCNRSAARLQLGLMAEALQDALEAHSLGPRTYANGWIRVIDCYYAVGKYAEATATLTEAVKQVPGFTQLPEFKAIKQALTKAGQRIKV